MKNQDQCPKCDSSNIYNDGSLWICPECASEWTPTESLEGMPEHGENEELICDANGNVLSDGDSVTLVKELKVKGASSSVKVGTKIKNIRLLKESEDGHNIACKVDGIGAINLKSEFVKKA